MQSACGHTAAGMQVLGAINIGIIYCQRCAPGGRARWVLAEALRRIEALLELPGPQAFFQPMLEAGAIERLPDAAPLLGGKRMLFDQGQVDDALETSAWRRHSRRRTVAALLPGPLAAGVMRYYGWNETPYEVGGPPWRQQTQGLVWDVLSYPPGAAEETVRACFC